MRIVEIVLIGIFALGVGFGIMHFPGHGVLKVLSLFFLAIIYFFFSIGLLNGIGFRAMIKRDALKNVPQWQVGVSIGLGIILSIAALGVLFTIQIWPGGTGYLWVGTVGLTITTIGAIIGKMRMSDGFFSRILKRAVLFGFLSWFLLFLPEVWFNWNYPDYPDYVKAVMHVQENPYNEVARMKLDEEREKMHVANAGD